MSPMQEEIEKLWSQLTEEEKEQVRAFVAQILSRP